MKKMMVNLAIIISCMNLSSCITSGGYMLSNRTSSRTVTLEDYYNLQLSEDEKNTLEQLVGEYEVVNAWGNITYAIHKVSFQVTENKVYVLTYMKGRSQPSYKVEFSKCAFGADNENIKYHIRHIGEPSVYCHNESKESSMVVIGKTTPQTNAKLTREELFTSVILRDKFIPVNDPYVMKVRIWFDGGAPILGLRKIQ